MRIGRSRWSRFQNLHRLAGGDDQTTEHQPGPGQELARRGIQAAKTGIIGRGSRVQIEWVPGHARVTGNELADS